MRVRVTTEIAIDPEGEDRFTVRVAISFCTPPGMISAMLLSEQTFILFHADYLYLEHRSAVFHPARSLQRPGSEGELNLGLQVKTATCSLSLHRALHYCSTTCFNLNQFCMPMTHLLMGGSPGDVSEEHVT